MKLKRMPAAINGLPSRIRTAPKLVEAFYGSPQWRSLVGRIKRERGGWCQRCGSTKRVAGDHIVERKDGGEELDPANIELLCQRCHNVKTAQRKAARVRKG